MGDEEKNEAAAEPTEATKLVVPAPPAVDDGRHDVAPGVRARASSDEERAARTNAALES